MRPRLTTGLPFSLAHTDAHALLQMHHTQVRSVAQYLPEDYFCADGRCPRVALPHALALMPALLAVGDEFLLYSWRDFLERNHVKAKFPG